MDAAATQRAQRGTLGTQRENHVLHALLQRHSMFYSNIYASMLHESELTSKADIEGMGFKLTATREYIGYRVCIGIGSTLYQVTRTIWRLQMRQMAAR